MPQTSSFGTPESTRPATTSGLSSNPQPSGPDESAQWSSGAGLDSDPGAAELTAYAKAKPVFETYCGQCHTTAGSKSSRGARKHFDMDAYPFGGHHASEMSSEIREVLGLSGAKATMPKDQPGKVQGEDLGLIQAWADAYDRAHERRGTGDDHASDEHERHEH
jgi:hypothetical protein